MSWLRGSSKNRLLEEFSWGEKIDFGWDDQHSWSHKAEVENMEMIKKAKSKETIEILRMVNEAIEQNIGGSLLTKQEFQKLLDEQKKNDL